MPTYLYAKIQQKSVGIGEGGGAHINIANGRQDKVFNTSFHINGNKKGKCIYAKQWEFLFIRISESGDVGRGGAQHDEICKPALVPCRATRCCKAAPIFGGIDGFVADVDRPGGLGLTGRDVTRGGVRPAPAIPDWVTRMFGLVAMLPSISCSLAASSSRL